MRTKIVAGNWKMNKNLQETKELLAELSAKLPDTDADVIVAPTFVNLQAAKTALQDSTIQVAAQNMHFAENGAYKFFTETENYFHVLFNGRFHFFGQQGVILAKVRTSFRVPKNNNIHTQTQ